MWEEIGKVAVLLVGVGLCGIGIAAVYFCGVATAEYWRRRRQRIREWAAYGQGYDDGKKGKPYRGDQYKDRRSR